jgi:hypothetical protein
MAWEWIVRPRVSELRYLVMSAGMVAVEDGGGGAAINGLGFEGRTRWAKRWSTNVDRCGEAVETTSLG